MVQHDRMHSCRWRKGCLQALAEHEELVQNLEEARLAATASEQASLLRIDKCLQQQQSVSWRSATVGLAVCLSRPHDQSSRVQGVASHSCMAPCRL